MFAVKAQITRCIDDREFPIFVECQLADAHGCIQVFHDKDAIFTTEMLDRNSAYPVEGIIGCEILERKNMAGRKIVKVCTELPWHIESTTGETVFEVLLEQIIEFEHAVKNHE